MAERKTQLEFFDRADRRGFVVDGQRDNLDARFGELFARTLKARELSLTVRTPCPPIEYAIWRDRIQRALKKMRERGELAASADPHELALALLAAVEGGLLLAKTTRSSRPLEIALDMAVEHAPST